METKLKNKWITVLRSGQYRQARGTLCRRMPNGDLGYCCLGVLGELIGHPSGAVGTNSREQGSPDTYEKLKSAIGEIEVYKEVIQMNDKRKSFNQIATYLESKEF